MRCISVVVQRPIPMVLSVQKTRETPLSLLNTVIDVLVAQVLQVQDSFCTWYLAVTFTVFGVRLWSTGLGLFWERTVSVFSGYMFGVSLRVDLSILLELFG